MWRISPLPFRWTISGQILFLDEHQAQITSNSRLVIRLRDVSSTTNELKVIASNTFNASLFPVQYNITYNPSTIIRSHIHVIDAIILNEENIKTFQSDRSVAVNLLGPGRTTYIDISLRAVYRKLFLIDSKSIEMVFFLRRLFSISIRWYSDVSHA